MKKRILSAALAFFMVLTMLPNVSLAAESTGCTHIHDEGCYAQQCVCELEHVHTEDCYESVLACSHVCDDTCGGLESDSTPKPAPMAPAAAPLAAATHVDHCACGEVSCSHAGHSTVNYIALTADSLANMNYILDGTTTPAHYYLADDITFDSNDKQYIKVEGTVDLCLNGHTLTFNFTSQQRGIQVASGATFNLSDCGNNGKLYVNNVHASDGYSDCGYAVQNSGTFNLYSGKLEAKLNDGNNVTFSGVYNNTSGTFNMYGGEVSASINRDNCPCKGVENYGTFCLYGGSITAQNEDSGSSGGVWGVYNQNSGTVKMTGGSVCAADAGSRTIYGISSASTAQEPLAVSGGTISATAASGNANGIHFAPDSAAGAMTFSGASVSAQSGASNKEACGIKLNSTNAAATVSGGSITVKNPNNTLQKNQTYGIFVYENAANDSLEVSGGTFDITAGSTDKAPWVYTQKPIIKVTAADYGEKNFIILRKNGVINGKTIVSGVPNEAAAKQFSLIKNYTSPNTDETPYLVYDSANQAVIYNATFTATVNLRQDNAAWTGSGKTVTLGTGTGAQAMSPGTDGTYTLSNVSTSQDVYVDNVNVGTVSLASPSLMVDYYTVTYYAGDGTGDVPTAEPVLKGQTYNVSTSSPLTQTGFTQMGWVTGSADAYTGNNTASVTVEDAVHLYPYWKLAPVTSNTGTITYNGETITNTAPYNGGALVYTENYTHEADGAVITYQWQSKTADSAFADIPNATNYTLNVGNVDAGTYDYRCVVTTTVPEKGAVLTANCLFASITITSAAQTGFDITTKPADDKITYGDSFTLAAAGGQSSNTATWSVTSGNAVIGADGKITTTGVGEVTVNATRPGGTNYTDATAEYTFTIEPRPLTITGVTAVNRPYESGKLSVDLAGGALQNTVSGDAIGFKLGTGTVEYADVGTGKAVTTNITLTGDDAGNYTLIQPTDVTVNITAIDPTLSINAPGTITYDGAAVTCGIAGEDLTYAYAGDGTVSVKWYADSSGATGTELQGAPTDVGSYWVGVSAGAGTNYNAVAEQIVRFTIGKAEYDMTGIAFENKEFTYNGQPQAPVITGTLPTGADGIQVTVGYSAGATNVVEGAVTVTATFATTSANYNVPAAMTATATIGQKDIKDAAIALGGALTYSGTVQTQEITGVTVDGLAVTYTVSGNEQTNAGTYELTVTGTGNFTGTATKNWSIGKKALADSMIAAIDGQTYTGGEIKPQPTVTDPAGKVTADDYTVAWSDNTAVGTATLTITATDDGNYSGTAAANFTISAKAIEGTVDVSIEDDGAPVVGKALTANYTDGAAAETYNYQWYRGEDAIPGAAGATYTLTAADKGSTIKVTVTGSGNYGGSKTSAPTAAVTDLTVTFDAQEGLAVDAKTGLGYKATIAQLPETSRTGYTFGGWFTAENGGGTELTTATEIKADATYYAKWTANTYTVAFDANGGTGEMASMRFTYDAAQKLTANTFTREGFAFLNWNTKVDGTGDAYTDEQSVQNLADAQDAAVTLYAQWSANPILGGTITGEGYTKVTAMLVAMDRTKTAVTVGGNAPSWNYVVSAPAGQYNLVVTATDGSKDITVTRLVELTSNIPDNNVDLPAIDKNSSVVEVVGDDTPNAIVGGLDTIADQDTGKGVTIKLSVEQKADVSASTDPADEEQKAVQTAIKTAAGGKKLDFIDMTLTRDDTEDFGSTNTTVLEIVIPFTTSGRQNITVYHKHGEDAAAALTKLTERPTESFKDGTFFVGDGFVVVYASRFSTYAIGYTIPSSGGSGGSSSYVPNLEEAEHGSFAVSPKAPSKGDKATITVKPDEGYVVDEVIVKDAAGNVLDITDNGDGTYSFTQPNSRVKITVTFRPAACEGGADCPSAVFTDVNTSAWYHEALDYVIIRGLMSGYGNNKFGPNDTLSRGMVVTILHRLEGYPSSKESGAFLDVPSNQYYADAVAWAAENGIVGGYGNGMFGPNDDITREQLAAILYRYAQYKGMTAVTLEENLIGFSDHEKISGYAVQAMNWAVGQKLINGVGDNVLNPQGNATRAQAAMILMRFCENKK